MIRLHSGVLLCVLVAAVAGAGLLASHAAVARSSEPLVLPGRIIATGIPGASAISAVGTFHAGGPIHDDAHFAGLTAPGQVLDPRRMLVASTSNFGAPSARPDLPSGGILSLDPGASTPLIIPRDFAANDGQASALDGAVQLFSAASPAFVNSINNSGAVTADLPSVSGPQAISINNGFGRLWFGNAPQGAYAAGSETIADADGRPLAGAPDKHAGGVFVGALTNRTPEQRISGALGGTIVGTALMGRSPDGSSRAVFAAVSDDGSVVQIHTERGLDGLSPPGTISPLPGPAAAGQLPLRAGALFNWVPDPILYVADPLVNEVAKLKLSDDSHVFHVDQVQRLSAPELATPVDLAPAVPEAANPNFSSNTTLAGGSDLFVANRRNGTILRLRQDGSVLAVASVEVPGLGVLGADRLNGIATSPDAQQLWVTVSGPLSDTGGSASDEGAVVELPAFGTPMTGAPMNTSEAGSSASLIAAGQDLFSTLFTPQDGLGPLFNARGCVSCHQSPAPGGMGAEGLGTVVRVGRTTSTGFDPLVGRGGPVARAHSVTELGVPCEMEPGIPASANVTSVRNAPALFGLGQLDAVPDATIRAGAVAYPDGVHGRPNLIPGANGTVHIGRFGWKADTPTLAEFVAGAFRTELGITNPLAPDDLVTPAPDCPGPPADTLRDDGVRVAAVLVFVSALDPPPPPTTPDPRGQAVFGELGCAECHAPNVTMGSQALHPYSDLLLHAMGPALDDGVVQGQATGRDWRTAPLWGLGQRVRFLHDGRARTIEAAISAHAGEAESAVQRFQQLAGDDHMALLRFLGSL